MAHVDRRSFLWFVVSACLIVGIFLYLTACDNPFDSPTEPSPFTRELTVDFSCGGISASGAEIQLNQTDGICRLQCVDQTSGGQEPYEYTWVSNLGTSHRVNPIFEFSDSFTFEVRLEVTDDHNDTSDEEKFFTIICV